MSTISRLFSLIGGFDLRAATGTASQTRAHDALVLLATLAKADGVLGASERTALAEAANTHIGNRADALAFLDDPNEEGLDDVAARIRRTWSEGERHELITKAMGIAEADGDVGEIEAAMLDRLARLLDVDAPEATDHDGAARQGLPDA